MSIPPRHDLLQAGASIEEKRNDRNATDFIVVYDGSFEKLQANTEHLYKQVGNWIPHEMGRMYCVEVVKRR